MSKRKNADDAPAAGTSVEQRPYTYIWLDCDPGHDDAMAIILATHYPDDVRHQEYVPHLVGVSTVFGIAARSDDGERAQGASPRREGRRAGVQGRGQASGAAAAKLP